MASFFAPLRRILRRDWKYGLWPLNGKKAEQLVIADLEKSLRATNGAIQALAEEIAMLRLPQDMTHDGQVEARNWCPGVQDIPPKMWLYDEFCSAGASDNPLSHIQSDGTIRNGLAHKFRGVVLLEGPMVIKERQQNDPKGPGGPAAKNPGGGQILIVNRFGQVAPITAYWWGYGTGTTPSDASFEAASMTLEGPKDGNLGTLAASTLTLNYTATYRGVLGARLVPGDVVTAEWDGRAQLFTQPKAGGGYTAPTTAPAVELVHRDEGSRKASSSMPFIFEANKGDTVQVHVAKQDNSGAGVAIHPYLYIEVAGPRTT